LERASQDEANDVSDRLVFAKVSGAFTHMSKQGPPFIALGDRVIGAIREHCFQEAGELANGFGPFEQIFGSDLAEIRKAVAQLTRESVSETRAQSGSILRVNLILFATAAVLGLSSFSARGYGLHRAFSRLIEGTRQVEQGQLTIELPVTSRDEIGQLTRAFNHMIRELSSII
jgi:HAMP domain-containing protein